MYGKAITSLGSHSTSRYGFVNETAIRLGAGIMFTIGFFSLLNVWYTSQYLLAFVVVTFFWMDFVLKVIQPHYSPINILADYLTKDKPKIRVGAIQKRFAWSLGLLMASIVMLMIGLRIYKISIGDHSLSNTASISPAMILCAICLVLMWMEAMLGYCVGCKIFAYLLEHRFVRNRDHQICPDDQCKINR